MTRSLAAIASACLLSSYALAGDATVESWSIEALLEEKVSDSAHDAETADAPATVTSLTREDIQLSGAVTIPDILRRVAGLQVVEVSEGNFMVSARGLGGLQANNVIVLLDGVVLNATADGSVRWGDIPVSVQQLDRIEVIRGPVSTLYGANASAAVVHLITDPRDPRPVVGTDIGARLPGRLERALWASGGGGGDAIGWRVDVRGWESRDLTDNDRPSRSSLASNVRIRYQMSPRLSGHTQVSWTLGVRGGENAIFADTVQYAEPMSQLVSMVEWKPEGRLESLTVDGGFIGWRTDGVGEMPSLSDAGKRESTGWLRARLRTRTVGEGQLIVSGGYRQETVESDALTIDVRGIPAWHAGVHAFQPVGERWRFDAAGRLDYHPLTQVRPSWRASALFAPSERVEFRASGGSAFRRPTWVETYARFRDPQDDVILLEGTPDLDPQQTTSIEAAVTIEPANGLWIREVAWVASFDNLISQDNNPFILKSFRNVSSTRLVDAVGSEAEVEWRRDAAVVPRLAVSALHLKEATDPGQSVGVPSQNPSLTISAGFRGALGPFRYGASVDWMAARTFDAAMGLPVRRVQAELPAMARLGAQCWWRITPNAPMHVGLLAETHRPSVRQSPLPGATPLGSRILFRFEVRE